MTYKTVLTILSGGPEPLRGLNAAVSKAISWDAHLEVLCVGVDASHHSYSYAEISPVVIQGSVVEAQAAARAGGAFADWVMERGGQDGFLDLLKAADIGRTPFT